MQSISINNLKPGTIVFCANEANFHVFKKSKEELIGHENITELYRIQGQKWRDCHNRVRDVTVASTILVDELIAANQLIVEAKKKIETSDLTRIILKHGVDLKSTTIQDNVVDFNIFTDGPDVAMLIKWYLRERLGRPSPYKSSISKIYLEGVMPDVDGMFNQAMEGVISET